MEGVRCNWLEENCSQTYMTDEQHLLGMDRDPVAKWEVFVRNVVVLLLDLYCVLKSKEHLSFDSPAETSVVRRIPTSAKFLVATSAGNQIQDLPRQPNALARIERLQLSPIAWLSSFQGSRRWELVLTRLRLGHTRLT